MTETNQETATDQAVMEKSEREWRDRTTAQRISDLMGDLGRIAHDSKNAYQKYDYASADAVYGALRPLMATHGLHVRRQEVSSEIIPPTDADQEAYMKAVEANIRDAKKPRPWLKIVMRFALLGPHDGNPTSDSPAWENATLWHPMDSVQSVGSAWTYAERYWLRGRLLIETGEPDADAEATDAPTPYSSRQRFVVEPIASLRTFEGKDGKRYAEASWKGTKYYTDDMELLDRMELLQQNEVPVDITWSERDNTRARWIKGVRE